MTDVMATCGDYVGSKNGTSACYISNHGAGLTFTGTVTLTAYDNFGTGVGVVVTKKRVELPEGPGVVQWFTASLPADRNSTSVISTVTDVEGIVISEHLIQLSKPRDMRVPVANVTFKVAKAVNMDGTIDITVSSRTVALFVTLTTLAQGRFSDNVFFLPATTKIIQFIPFSPLTASKDLETLQSTLRIEDFSMYRPLP